MASSTRSPAIIGGVVSVVLIAAGVAVWLTAPNTDASFGWFAYAPLGDDVFAGPLILYGQRLLAAGLVAAGLVIAGVAVGFRWGRSVGRVETRPGPDPFSHPPAE